MSSSSSSSSSGVGAALFVAATGLAGLLQRFRRQRQRRRVIAELWLYPIKGCRGFRVNEAAVTRRGLKHDRMLMVVNAEEIGKFISQRSHPKMTLISTRIEQGEEGETLVVSTPGRPELRVALPRSYDNDDDDNGKTPQASLQVSVWGTTCAAVEVSPLASQWFSDALTRGETKENLRLVRMASAFVRPCKKTDGRGQTGFADGYPFLLAAQESLAELNARLAQGGKKPVTLEHFRPNIVVSGGKAWEEDSWSRVAFSRSLPASHVSMQCVSPCSRCKVPTNDPNTGQFDAENEPSRTMKQFREGRHLGLGLTGKDERELFFGTNLDHASLNAGLLREGDDCEWEGRAYPQNT